VDPDEEAEGQGADEEATDQGAEADGWSFDIDEYEADEIEVAFEKSFIERIGADRVNVADAEPGDMNRSGWDCGMGQRSSCGILPPWALSSARFWWF
jgi:hypothetical protein